MGCKIHDEHCPADSYNHRLVTQPCHNAEVSGSAIAFLVLEVLFMASVVMKKSGRAQRTAAREKVLSLQLQAADKQEAAAHKAFTASVIAGSFQVAGGLAGLRGGYLAGKAPNTGEAQRLSTLGASASTALEGLGSLIAAFENRDSQLTEAEAERLRALATEAQGLIDEMGEFVQEMTDAEKKAYDSLVKLMAEIHETINVITSK